MSRRPNHATPPIVPGASDDSSARSATIADLGEAPAFPAPVRLTYRLAELAKSFGISRRTLERERSAGRFPRPDLTIGKAPLWKPETIRRWIDGGGHR